MDLNNNYQQLMEELREEMNKQLSKDCLEHVKVHYIDYDNDINQIKTGFDWLCENMKPIK